MDCTNPVAAGQTSAAGYGNSSKPRKCELGDNAGGGDERARERSGKPRQSDACTARARLITLAKAKASQAPKLSAEGKATLAKLLR